MFINPFWWFYSDMEGYYCWLVIWMYFLLFPGSLGVNLEFESQKKKKKE